MSCPPLPETPSREGALRVVVWNVLAPELLLFFWRSSYGLPLLASPAAYDALTARRLASVAAAVRRLAPDVLLLQEVSDGAQAGLGGATMVEFLCGACGLALAGASFKASPFRYGLPPREQPPPPHRSGGAAVATMDSGVATLYDASRVLLLRHLGGAEAGGPCSLFRSGVGSPFTADEFSLRGGGGGGGGSVTLVNVHIRMLYPNIAAPLAEVLRRAAALGVPSDWRRAVLAGDLNAGTAEAAADLAAALAAPPGAALRDVPTTAAAVRCDDHVLCGPALRVLSAARDGSLPLLDMLTRSDGVPTSDYKLWGTPDTPYAVHAGNAALIETAVSSDHPPLIVEIAVE